MSDYFNENDPEAIAYDDNERSAELRADYYEWVESESVDPFEDWFAPGYATEMDYLNSLEADDYTHEFDDMEDF